MKPRELRPAPKASLTALHHTAWLLLAVLSPGSSHATGRSSGSSPSRTHVPEGSRPYLRAIGAAPLRFQEFVPPPDLSTRLPVGAPSLPAPTNKFNTDVIVPIPEETGSSLPPPAPKTEVQDLPVAPKKAAPAAIIPDDTRPQVRPEDFLPYFQTPGSRRGPAEVNVIAPVPPSVPPPAPLAPSSATYTQTPR